MIETKMLSDAVPITIVLSCSGNDLLKNCTEPLAAGMIMMGNWNHDAIFLKKKYCFLCMSSRI